MAQAKVTKMGKREKEEFQLYVIRQKNDQEVKNMGVTHFPNLS